MKILGGILLAVGILIAGASGLCSLSFLAMSLSGGDASIVPLVLVIGGIPFACGVGTAILGVKLAKGAKQEDEAIVEDHPTEARIKPSDDQ